jgi:salicylate hydroxylase
VKYSQKMSVNESQGTSGHAEIHFIVIGAGLAGLSGAISAKLGNPSHKVTICETVKDLQEVGVSQIKPSLLARNHAN